MNDKHRSIMETVKWYSVEEALPEIGTAVFLYEKGRTVWIGSREELQEDGETFWLWTRSEYFPEFVKGEFRAVDAEWDDDYKPSHWHPFPTIPQ